jgi:hypothetical protein
MMLTFLTLAQAQGLTPVGYESEAEGLLENVEGKCPPSSERSIVWKTI